MTRKRIRVLFGTAVKYLDKDEQVEAPLGVFWYLPILQPGRAEAVTRFQRPYTATSFAYNQEQKHPT